MDAQRKPVRVTSFDVAEKAGVSQSTVSRALSGSAVITEGTRTRVLEAARELGYFVDERAARLRRGHTGTLAAVVICKPGYSAKDVNPFSYALLGGICTAASARGLEVLVSLQAEEDQLFGHYVERGQAEGLIVIGTTANRAAWEFFRKIGEASQPVAYWGSPMGDLDWVSSDNHAGARLAAEHLAGQGCKGLVCIGSHGSVQRQFAERTDSFMARATELGVKVDLIAIEQGKDRREQGRLAAQALLRRGEPFDGVFAVCDAIAFGVLEAFHAAGVRIPGDVKVVGFDGLPAGELSNPPLTTIEPDLDLAGRLLVEAVSGEDVRHPSVQRVPVRLLVRASS
ncbi:MAG: LacI family transcriptional regulator [Sphingomonadales bacterium BRH_c3]|nr:MAG: LacI family transcriptional regulator [Sphingomonadales bacterium BRH_c3]